MSRRIALQMHRLDVANPTGVHRYATELAAALVAQAPPGDRVELWSGDRPAYSGPSGVALRTWPVHRRLVHLSWLLAHRPPAERFTGPVSLVHSLTPAVPVPARGPLVVTVHDVLPLQHPEWYSRFERVTVVAALRHAAAEAARLIVPSSAVAGDVETVLGVAADRVVVVPEGVTGALSEPVPPGAVDDVVSAAGLSRGRYLVTVGAVGPRKNIEVLLDALATLPEAERPALVVVGGDGGSLAGARARADALELSRSVRFTGRVDDHDLAAWVQGAAALVHPARYEGFGLPVVEAMAAGTPVIVSAAGSLPEVVGDAGVTVGPDDVEGRARRGVHLGTSRPGHLAGLRRSRSRPSGVIPTKRCI
jgi:glycosyltransferase involved in cell wall biosynthesis